MPRGKKNIVLDEKTQDTQDLDIVKVVSNLLSEVEGRITERIAVLSSRVDNIEKQPVQLGTQAKKTLEPIPSSGFVPSEIRDAVSSVLSPSVGVSVQDSPNSPSYTVTIQIPDELSPIPEIEKPDVRSKTVRISEGVPKIREWLDIVKVNIYNEFKKQGKSVPNI